MLALGLASSCSCDDETFVAGSASIRAEPTRVELGRVFVGAAAEATVALEVRGDVFVNFVARFDGGDPSGFRAGPAAGRIGPGGRAQMTVRFAPRRAGARQTTIVVEHDAADTPEPLVIELSAVGAEPPDCEDGNGCTLDSFDIDAGVCRHEAARIACDDFNACTRSDTCVEGVCLGESVLCDDDNLCTDDVCDPQQGCLHIPTRGCDDGNPCTRDFCDARGCQHEVLEDGTPCDDLLQCTIGDICLFGQCRGVNADDGVMCDDMDPCSLNDQCIDGICLDPSYDKADPGELKFATRVGELAPGSANNPIVDRDSSVFVGTHHGVAAVDQCGALLWRNDALGTPRFGAAVSLPGILGVPIGSELVDLDTSTGDELGRLDLAISRPPPVETASTATVTVEVLDMALRASGGVVVSLWREVSDPPHVEGWLAEVDPTHSIATLFRPLGQRRAVRLAIDADEAVVALLEDGVPGDLVTEQQIVRFGLEGLPETTWSSSPARGVHTDLAIGAGGEVLWTAGLVQLTRTGTAAQLLAPPRDPLALEAGAPVLDPQAVFHVVREDRPPESGPDALPGGTFFLRARTATTGEVRWQVELPARAVQATPAVDATGNVFVALEDGSVVGYDPGGRLLMQLQLPLDTLVDEPIALTLTPERVLVVVTQQTVFGVQSLEALSSSAWPRHRRDNLSTGHR